MKLPLKQLSIGVMLISVLAGCENKNNNANSKINETNKTTQPDTANKSQNLTPTLTESSKTILSECKFEIKGNPEEEFPEYKVWLKVNGKKKFLKTVYCSAKEIESSEFERYEIPKNAISACGGWYAGGGDYIYLMRVENSIEVFYGWVDEGQTDEGFHWKKEKTITL
jgi:hypothetical protein